MVLSMSQLLCSIEKAVLKLAQSGLSTAAKIYYYRIFYTSTFFFKWPYLGNETTNFISAGAKILVLSRAFTHSFMKVTSPHSFTLFRPLSWKKPLFRGVPRFTIFHKTVRICPRDHFPCRKKEIYLATHSLAGRVKFVKLELKISLTHSNGG